MCNAINWKNVDLNDAYNRDKHIIDPLSFNTLLLEIECNLPLINEGTVTAQFEEGLETAINSAREVFKNNLKNIIIYAKKERE